MTSLTHNAANFNVPILVGNSLVDSTGSNGLVAQVLTSTSNGVLWLTANNGNTTGIPGGINSEFQFNSNGVFGGANVYFVSGNTGFQNTTPDATLHVEGTSNLIGNVIVGGTLGVVVITTLANLSATNTSITGILTLGTIVTNSTTITIGNSTVNTSTNSTLFTGTANNATNFGGQSLATVQGWITGNATTAFVNAIANSYSNITSLGFSNSTNGLSINGNISGTAANATNLNSQPGSYYTNATNITTGVLPWGQAPAGTVNTSGAFTFSGVETFNANIFINVATLSIGNSTSNITINTTVLAIGNSTINSFSNSTTDFIGNSTVNTTINATVFSVANSTANIVISATTITIGNASVNTTINS